MAISGRDGDWLAAAEQQLRATGAEVVALRADVATPEGAAMVDEAVERLGGVDILVANAGGPPPGTFASTSLDGYREALDLNLLGTVAMCQRAVPAMQAAGWGRVVAITSIGARQPIGRLDGVVDGEPASPGS
ncbi:MAG: SDR family NAD(P)-dependent oxidoreductase [Acidimicrobiales bacterium]